MKDLTEGNVAKLIFQFTLPMLIGNIFQQTYNIVDSVIVGNYLGKQALAAVGASFPIIFILISLVIGVASGMNIIVAQYFGAKDFAKVRRTIDTMYIFIFTASLIVTVVGIFFSEDMLRLTRLPEELIPIATIYLQVYFAGVIFLFGFNATCAVLRGLGDSKTPLYFLIISSLANIVLVLLFVMVFKWGIAGAAAATVIAEGGAFLTGAWYLNRTHPLINVSLRKPDFDWEILRQSIRIGLPSGIQQTLFSLGMMTLMWIVNRFGTNVIAAYSVAGRVESLAIMPAMNFSMALATFTGQNIGANKRSRLHTGLKSTLLMSSITSIILTLLIIIFSKYVMRLFTTDMEVIRIGQEYLMITCSFYIVFSSLFTFNGLLRGAGDTWIPMLISLFSLWLFRIPLAYFCSQHFGERGIWWAIPIGWCFGAIVSFFYYKTGKWKNKAVVKYSTPEILTDAE
jgi:putative MATE family efflux protein